MELDPMMTEKKTDRTVPPVTQFVEQPFSIESAISEPPYLVRKHLTLLLYCRSENIKCI